MTHATLAELDAFLTANPDLECVEAFITDANGIARGKLLRICELAALYREGRPLPGSILSLDTTGREVDETGLTWECGDADQVARAVPRSLCRASWRTVPTAQVLLSLWDAESGPHAADPRHVLAAVVDRLVADGYVPVVAAELEFYVVDATRPPGPPSETDAYSVMELEGRAPFLDELFACARVMGLPLETAISENGPGQLEIVLRHRADALRAADDAVQWKRLVRGVASKHGLLATFMAKPFTACAGSGLHVHASLEDDHGNNRFASDAPGGSLLMRHAIGGLLATLGESLGVFAPNANSYRRFQAASYAPVSPTWGINNRSVAVRVPTGAAASRHLEHRVSGADANPYLAIAAVLAGMHHGIAERIDPGPPTTGNAYAAARATFTTSWPEAIRRVRESAFLVKYFGARFVEIYGALKAAEHERFHALVSDVDRAWYLTRA